MSTNQWIGSVVLVVIAAGLVFGIQALISGQIDPEVRLPALAIAGVLALLIALALVAGAFTLFNLSTPKEALGLPEGSVRAVIALSLIVLLAIFAIYLYTTLNGTKLERLPNLTVAEKDSVLSSPLGARVVTTISGGTTDDKHFTVLYRSGTAAGEDFAKQLLVMIGTLVTSVASFYFGSKSVTPPDSGPKAKPALRSIAPTTLARSPNTFDLQVNGDSLDLIKEVKITLGGRQIVATGVVSNASIVKCQLIVTTADPAGAWTVVATDGSGQSVQLPGALNLT